MNKLRRIVGHDYIAGKASHYNVLFMKAFLTLSTLFLILALLVAPSVSAKGPFLTVHTDASSYTGAQTLTASGAVTPPPGPNTAVFLQILFPSGKPAAVASAAVNGTTGLYQQKFVLGGSSSWIAGTYTVNASWGSSATTAVSNMTTFTYTPATTTTSTTTTTTSTTSTTTSATSTSTTTTSTTSSTTSSTTTTSPPATTTSTAFSSTTSTTTTTSSTTSSTTSTSTGGGGIPEYPYQLLATSVFATLLVASYLLVRRRWPSAGVGGRPSIEALHEAFQRIG